MKIGGSKTRKELIAEEEDQLFVGLSGAITVSSNKDSVISAQLSQLKLDPTNGRIGQQEIVDQLDQLVAAIKTYHLKSGNKSVPYFETLAANCDDVPRLSRSATMLYNSCADLANSFIQNDGYADTPPKVMALNSDGFHLIKTGHRRTIAYHLASPITNVSVVDVLVDKSKMASQKIYQAMGRVAENNVRLDNSLAELMLSVAHVLELIKNEGQSISNNKLSQATGIERTKLGRIIEVIESGFANQSSMVRALHENKVEDIQAISLLVRQPQDQWKILIQELIEQGSSWFRNQYRDGATKPQSPKIDSGPQDAKHNPVYPPAEPEIKPTKGSTSGKEEDKTIAKNVAPANRPEVAEKSVEEVAEDNNKSTVLAASIVAGDKENLRERGARKLLEIIKRADNSLKIPSEGNCLEILEELIVQFGSGE